MSAAKANKPSVCDTFAACVLLQLTYERNPPTTACRLFVLPECIIYGEPLGDHGGRYYSLSRSLVRRRSPFSARSTRLSACGRGRPCEDVRRGHSIPPRPLRAKNMYRPGRWGAPRLLAAALSSLPACVPGSPAVPAIYRALSTHPPPALGRVR